jgi:hypothetical protein
MAMWRGYIGIENLGLNNSQKQVLLEMLRALGPAEHPSPAYLCHWVTRLDGDAAIFEAYFDKDNISIDKFKERLGSIFAVDPDTINHSSSSQQFSDGTTAIITFSRGGDKLRLALFGGSGCSWEESHDEVLGYLAANRSEWENE